MRLSAGADLMDIFVRTSNSIECISGFSALLFVVVERMLPRVLRRSPVSLLVVRVVPAAPHAVPDVVVDDEIGFLVSYLSPRLVGSVGRNREWQNLEWQNWAGDRGHHV